MNSMHEYLSTFPEFMQRPIAGLSIIIIGYFASKIFAAIAGSITLKLTPSKNDLQTDVKPLHFHIGKIIFWSSWLVFIVLGLKQVHPYLFDFSEFSIKSIDYLQLFTIALGACVILLSESYITRYFESLRDSLKSIPVSKNNFTFRIAKRFAWILFFAIFVIALASTDTLGNKVAITLFLLFVGWLFSNVVKQAIKSFIQPFGVKSEFWPKFFSYVIFVHFLISAINLWK